MTNSYGFDPVAWSVDGGRHRGELLRVLAFASTGGTEGIVSPQDCKVHQLTTPGGQVAIDAGALLIRNRSANVRNQTYIANGRTETRLDVTPTGSAGGRRDLVVVRIEDPQYSPWPQPAPAAAPDYQYVKPFIIENVPAGTTKASQINLGYSAVELAYIDIPANTSTITNAMIKDARTVAQPRTESDTVVWYPPDASYYTPAKGQPRGWFPKTDASIFCPEWATEMRLVVSCVGVGLEGQPMWGRIRAEYGWGPTDGGVLLATEETGIAHSATAGTRQTLIAGGSFKVPAAFRGKSHFVRTGTVLDPGAAANARGVQDKWTTVIVDYTFKEVAE